MSKELPYFQFEPAQWMMGRIQRCSGAVKGAYIDLCARYWNKQCQMSLDDAQLDCGENEINELLKRKIILENEGMIFISFLDSQLSEISTDHKNRSISGKIGNLKRWHPKLYKDFTDKKISLENAIDGIASQSHPDTQPIAPQSQNIADKIREEEIKGDKIKEEEKRKYNKRYFFDDNKVIFPFNSKEFINAWVLWINYRTQIKKKITGSISAQGQLKSIEELSKGNEQIAIEIINQSIKKGWQGLFELKSKDNGKSTRETFREVTDLLGTSRN